jgi:hypothetical protein
MRFVSSEIMCVIDTDVLFCLNCLVYKHQDRKDKLIEVNRVIKVVNEEKEKYQHLRHEYESHVKLGMNFARSINIETL